MTKIFAVYCPTCETETPISTKNKEVLSEMKAKIINMEKRECLNCKQQPEKYYAVSGSTEIYCWSCLNQVLEQNKQRIFLEVFNGATLGKSICPWCKV
ncbi:9098_t:CDS:2 [Entrophospora sp. SA101]|nr:3945_t:CDS:2 [Entrophospora sp. SA101]CAJ0844963.1 9098_t:CDS:2 [Entrophospora sp. SA101]